MQRLFVLLFFIWSTEAIVSWSSSPSQVAYEIILQLNETAGVSCVVSADKPTPTQIRARRNATGKLTGKSSSTICLEGTDCALQIPMIAINDVIWCTADGLETVEPSAGVTWTDPAVPFIDSGVALAGDVDQFWLLFGSTLVFFMQIGFASLEAGICRVRNVTNMLYVNFVDCGLSAIIFWSIGWAFSFGGDSVPSHQKNGFISYYEFFLVSGDGQLPRPRYMLWLFQWAFCSAAATIVTGAIAERARVIAYFTMDTVVSAWIYPVIIHWMWSNHGWLSPFADNETHKRVGTNGVIDFAGSCSVHLCGGTCSLVGAIILGPRKGRFSKMPETPEEQAIRSAKFQPHNRVLTCLGAFFLWFGWYGFNCCSTLLASNSSSLVAGKVAVTTTMGTAGGIFGALVVDYAVTRTLGLDSPMNGSLIGLVSITSGCAVIEPWAALVIGFIGGMLYVVTAIALEKVKIDDPVGAVPVHFMGGLWGTIAPGLFCTRDNLKQAYNLDKGVYGLFYGGGGQQLGIQILGAVVVMAWSGFFAFLTFAGLRVAGLLRVPEETEEEGLDTTEHGASVYNDDFTAKQVLLNTQENKSNNRNGENYYPAFTSPAPKELHDPYGVPNSTPTTRNNDIPV